MVGLRFTRILAIIGLAAVLAGCGGASQPAAPGSAGSSSSSGKLKVLRMAQASETVSVDPAPIEDPWSIQPIENLWDPLTQLDSDYKIKPAVAKEWSVSSDGLTWTFKLRNDVKWSNGEQVTAKDFKYAINRIAWPETKAPYVFLLDGIQGAKDVEAGKTRDVSGVKVVDDYTLQFTLTEPEAYFLAMTATWVFSPINQKAVEQYGDQWATPGKLVNDGAFLLKSWDRPTKMVLVANPNYYGGRPKIDEIDINIVKDPNTALLQYENGQLDIVDVPDSEFQRIKSDPTLSKELHDIPLIVDEVVTLRLATGGAQQLFGLEPDLTIMGKIIGGGLPVGGVGGRREILDLLSSANGPAAMFQSGTFAGNPMSMAAGAATLTELTEGAIRRMNDLGEHLTAELAQFCLAHDLPVTITGLGSLVNFHFARHRIRASRDTWTENKAQTMAFFKAMLHDGFHLTLRCGVSLSTPMTESDLEAFLAAATRNLQRVCA